MIRVANVLIDARHLAGPQQRAIQVGERLLEQDVQTHIVISSIESEAVQERLRDSNLPWTAVRLHRLTRERKHLLGWLFSFPVETFALTRLLRRIRPDIVHVNGVWQVKGVLAGRLAGAKVVLHLNDTVVYALLKRLYLLVAPLANGFIFAAERSRDMYTSIRRYPAKPQSLVPAPVNVERFKPDSQESSTLLGSANGPCILTIGHVNYVKGIKDFVKMAGAVLEVRPDATFHVIGKLMDSQQQYIDQVRALIAELPEGAVTLHGSSNDIPALLKAADVYVCSSISEASPMAVWEAMAMKVPVVSTDVGDVPVYIKDGVNGFVVPVGDTGAMAEKVLHLLDRPALAEQFGEASREVVLKHFSLQTVVQKHWEAYRALLG